MKFFKKSSKTSKSDKEKIDEAIYALESKIDEITNKRNEFNILLSERKAELLMKKHSDIDKNTIDAMITNVNRLSESLKHQDNVIFSLKNKRDEIKMNYLEADINYSIEKTNFDLDLSSVTKLINDLDNLGYGLSEVNNLRR